MPFTSLHSPTEMRETSPFLFSLPLPLPMAAIGDMSSGRVWAIVLGILLAIVAVTLLIASWTKWGQTKSLTKCIALAVMAHVWLLMYAYGTRIVMPGTGGGNQGGVRDESFVSSMMLLESMPTEPDPDTTAKETEQESAPESIPEMAPWEAPLEKSIESERQLLDAKPDRPELPSLPKPTQPPPALANVTEDWLAPDLPPIDTADQIAALAAMPELVAMSSPPSLQKSPSSPPNSQSTAVAVPTRKLDQQPIPIHYQMRLSPQRQQFAMQNGGDANTEAAVERALAWLARSQSPDGSWNAAEHGAGSEPTSSMNRPDGEDRHNAGMKANTAMTGLALLAFLGAGHTHTDGRYQDTVTRGLKYLLSQQLPSGDLSGRDQVGREPTVRFARMYSHGMAALSLTEAYGMTGDAVLLQPIQNACRYTLNAMNPRTGGWRYEFSTDEPGDMSQFGWQAMVLNSSAKNQSIALPQQTRDLLQRFLDSVSVGRYGGLGIYRPRVGENPTPAMTAELLASRLLVGFPLSRLAAEEGQWMMLNNLPGRSEENLYYWYYATIAMYQMRGDPQTVGISPTFTSVNSSEQAWTQWNEALKQQLCATQVPRGKTEGSWNPSCVWGAYGGRVYSTAMACMSLEVYYRYLPMHQMDQIAIQQEPARR